MIKHAMDPFDTRPRGAEIFPRCGADRTEPIALWTEDVTCPNCLKRISSAALRSGLRQAVEKGQSAVGLAVMDLCVWEGRGDWATLPTEYREQCGRQAYDHLQHAITALEVQRAQLWAVLKMEGNTPE